MDAPLTASHPFDSSEPVDFTSSLNQGRKSSFDTADHERPEEAGWWKRSKCARFGVCCCAFLAIFLAAWFLIMHFYIAGLVKGNLNATPVVLGPSTFYDPLGMTIMVRSSLSLDMRPFFPATIVTNFANMSFCPPEDSPVYDNSVYNLTCELKESVFGRIALPNLELHRDNLSYTPIDEQFNIVNIGTFKYFTGVLLDGFEVPVQISAMVDVDISVFGLYTMRVKDVLFNTSLVWSGLGGLPGVYTGGPPGDVYSLPGLDFIPPPEGETDPWENLTMPYLSMTVNVYNQGTTNITDMGVTRFDFFTYGPTQNRSDAIEPDSYLAIGVMSTGDLRILTDWTAIPGAGPIVGRAGELQYRGVDRLISGYVNGVNGTLKSIITGSPCCLENITDDSVAVEQPDCCVPASDIPLWNIVLEGTPVKIICTAPPGGFSLVPSLSLRFDQSGNSTLSAVLSMSNPFGTELDIYSVNLQIYYLGVKVASYQVLRPAEQTTFVIVPPYGEASHTSPGTTTTLTQYAAGSEEEAVMAEWMDQLSSSGSSGVACTTVGEVVLDMLALKRLRVDYGHMLDPEDNKLVLDRVIKVVELS